MKDQTCATDTHHNFDGIENVRGDGLFGHDEPREEK
jgi:hypothetical protein